MSNTRLMLEEDGTLHVYSYDPVIISAIWSDDQDEPYNLTGWSAKMQIRLKATDATAIASFSTDDGSIELTADGLVLISSEDVADWNFTCAEYDVIMEDPDGNVVPWIEKSKVVFHRSVTR